MKVVYTVFLALIVSGLFGQVAINSDGGLSDSSAILDVKSTSKGLLIPRMMQSERDSIKRPANGLLVFCIDNNRLYVNRGTPGDKNWVTVADDELMQDSLNDCFRRSDTAGILLSRQRAALEYETAIIPGETSQFWNGKKQWTTLNTGVVPEQPVNLYFTCNRVRNTSLTGLNIESDSVTTFDSILSAIGKLQGQINGKDNLLTFEAPLLRTVNVVSIPHSDSLQNGYLSSADWIAFHNKQNQLATGTVSAGSDIIILTGTPENSIIGPGFSVDINSSKIDHNTLLNYSEGKHFFQKAIDTVNTALSGLVKASAGKLTTISDNSSNWDAGYSYRLTTASGTAPLLLTLASNGLTGSIPQASALAGGYLTSADWLVFSNKQPALGYVAENQANKSSNTNLGDSDDLYPTQNAVKTYVNGLSGNYVANSGNLQTGTFHITGNGWVQNGNIGIGTTVAPAFQLDINGSSNIMRIQTLPFNNTNTSVLVVDDATGVVSKRTDGFGTVTNVTATAPLQSSGGAAPNVTLTGIIPVANGGSGASALTGYLKGNGTSAFSASATIPASALSGAIAVANGGTGNVSIGPAGSIAYSNGTSYVFSGTGLFWDNTTGRFGIGTTNPQASLSVGSSSQFQVASDGHCVATGAFGSTSPLTGINTSGTGVTGNGTVYGVYGQSTIGSGERAGGYFYTSSNAYARVGGYKQTSPGVYEAYLIWGVGKLVTQNKTTDGSVLDLYSPVCPETIITDYGTGKLIHGKCHVNIDPSVAKRIFVSKDHPIRVFVQPEEDCKGVFVANKSAEGFDVIELMGGNSDAGFSWSFSANLIEVTADGGNVDYKNIGVRSTEYKIQPKE